VKRLERKPTALHRPGLLAQFDDLELADHVGARRSGIDRVTFDLAATRRAAVRPWSGARRLTSDETNGFAAAGVEVNCRI
jgi:hypothetical protein